MVKSGDLFTREVRSKMRGGDGEIHIAHIWKPGEEMKSHTRMFSKLTVNPGCSIGYHVHENEEEIFYLLSGSLELDDNGVKRTLKAGESSITRGGEGHGVRNIENVPAEILAVIGKY